MRRSRLERCFGGTAPLAYQAALKADQIDMFVIYATSIIAVSLVVYVFFLKNKDQNWLDDEAHMHARIAKRR